MAQQKEPSIEDYKKYTRELKLKIKRLQEKNQELLNDNAAMKDRIGADAPAGAKPSSERLNFAIGLNNKVTRAQVGQSQEAVWRMVLARRNYRRMLGRASRAEPSPVAPTSNQLVMLKAKEAADRLGLSLEMLFRAADEKCEGQLLLEDFKLFLRKVRLKMTPGQVTRFLFLVDEECRGTISKLDYLSTLAAYGVNTERGWAQDSFRTFEQQ